MHALSAEYNILYNGGIALDKGVEELKAGYKDNFWQRLPIERMQTNTETLLPGQKSKNSNFERAESKAIKAIQKHAMDIAGVERNPQMDEAHLLLGKARYFDQRFVPSIEAFNYVLYKYANSDKIYEVKVWREKANLRLENDALAVKNLKRLLSENKLEGQVLADANATLAQAFINTDEIDCAVERLKVAIVTTKLKEERARYRFILGQLYEELNEKDSAFAAYQSVIDMKRKSPKRYVIQAHARQAQQFDYENGDTVAFLKKYKKLFKDRENRPFLDVLNHQMGLFYDKFNKPAIAEKYYNQSLRKRTDDSYLAASNYRNLAYIYFKKAKFKTSGDYYDSTLVQLDSKTREYAMIKKKRANLDEVIKQEGLVSRNDSILNVLSLSKNDQVSYYEKHIEKLKAADAIKKALEEKLKKENAKKGDSISKPINEPLDNDALPVGKLSTMPPGGKSPPAATPKSTQSDFYFYTASTVAFGKASFLKNWGERSYKNNWRLSLKGNTEVADDSIANDPIDIKEGTDKAVVANEKYDTNYYLKQLPTSKTEIDSIIKERDFSNYQLGSIYKEKFKEYELAAAKYEKLLSDKPEEKLILPSMYNLYKIYEIIDKKKMLAIKQTISSKYPESRYAQILNNENSKGEENLTPENNYSKTYKLYEEENYRTVLLKTTEAINQYPGESIVPKFELLKANTIGKLKGVEEYKKALNVVSLDYPYSEEGKQADLILGKDIPTLEALKLNAQTPKSWKILYKVNYKDTIIKRTQDTIAKFIKVKNLGYLKTSNDSFTMEDNFIVIHNFNSEESAKQAADTLKNSKKYKVAFEPIVISNYNYRVVQIKKNLEEYITLLTAPVIPKTDEKAPEEDPKTDLDKKDDTGAKDPVNTNLPGSSTVPPKEEPKKTALPSNGMPPTITPDLLNKIKTAQPPKNP